MEHHGAKIMICVTIAVWSFLLLKDSHTSESRPMHEKWTAVPSMDVFENYEDMQKYINEKESKGLTQLANPWDDSYIKAYNYHHESPGRFLVKRGTETVESPKIFKFEISDAREPDEATKKLIQIHRGRELQRKEETPANLSQSVRSKRQITEPQFIRFEVSDAKDPDEATKEIIRKSRAKLLLSTTTKRTTSLTIRPTKSSARKVTRQRKRTRRSTPEFQPQFIRFELEDAKEPDSNFREMINQMKERERQNNARNDVVNHQINETQNEDDSSSEESKRYYYYQAIPVKSKRVVNAVPTEVQKIIEMMLKDSKAQSYYKYVTNPQDSKLKVLGKIRPIYGPALASGAPAQAAPAPVAENLVTVYPEPAYVQKIVPIPVPVHTFPVTLLPPPHPSSTASSPHQLLVPEISNKEQYYHTITPPQQPPNIYHHPTTYVKIIPAMSQVFHELPATPIVQPHQQPYHQVAANPTPNAVQVNEISKRNPYAKVVPLEASYRHGKHLHIYSSISEAQQSSLPVGHIANNEGFKVEPQQLQQVHNQQYEINGNNINELQQQQQQPNQQEELHLQQQQQQKQIPLKDMQEFQELSALIGKSPTDQIHGLAYLLAKEMQRSKRLKGHRPQDNTSPILFHPEKNVGAATATNAAQVPPQEYIGDESKTVESQPSKEYTPIVEPRPHVTHVNQVNSEPTAVIAPPPPPPPPTSYAVLKTLGLSPNYKGLEQYEAAAAIHPDTEDGRGLQYASKYAFGYRVRDFHSGNDFGHKQNRDLDGVTRGQYHILLPDGRVQNVIYHADDTGFHADVVFETGHR